MSFIDLILNLAGLLLWLKWREGNVRQNVSMSHVSVVFALKKAETRRAPKIYLWVLLGLLLLRALIYWWLGAAVQWIPTLSLGTLSLSFRSDYAGRIFLYSFLGFALLLASFYFSLLFLSMVNGRKMENDAVQQLVRTQLGKLDVLPLFAKLLLPWLVVFSSWFLLNKPLVMLGVLPPSKSLAHILQQSAIVGLGIYLTWKYVITGILLLYIVNSYVYLGNSTFWAFISNTTRRILFPISWIPLRLGKVDLAPVLVLVLLLFGAEGASRGLVWVYQRLPF